MKWKAAGIIGLSMLAVAAITGYWYLGRPVGYSIEKLNALKADTLAQNEQAISKPEPRVREKSVARSNNNVYFGDTHVHTALSFDSYLSGNRAGLRGAYRFASGEPLVTNTGEVMQLGQPLDFVAMADHAESFGLFVTCAREGLTARQQKFCAKFKIPDRKFFVQLRNEAVQRPPQKSEELCGDDPARCMEDAKTTWREIYQAAEEFYRPGEFTTFAAYEYSASLPKSGNLHRNILFKNNVVPGRALSSFDALTALDLWKTLEQECKGDCEFLTIPHNMNKSWGLAYSGKTIDGDIYTKSDWALRARNEPLAEIIQIKGNSECGFGLGASDEECNFELFLPLCEGDERVGCSSRTSFAREGLKIGMRLAQDIGFNPLQFGFIGSTDTHNSNPGDTEEYDYRGAIDQYESPAVQRLNYEGDGEFGELTTASRKNPGGLAAVWARENTREAIFEAMQRRETFATSGTRIKLRFFAGWNFEDELIRNEQLISLAYQSGVPMGGMLPPADTAQRPKFLVWAMKDPAGANLQRIQMVKAWVENGESREQVFDIACSDDLQPDPGTGRCPDNGAVVNLSTCSASPDKGAAELRVLWTDPGFSVEQSAFYYVRVLENPSCRWSSYDAIRLGVAPRADLAQTVRERAWSSPIWYESHQ